MIGHPTEIARPQAKRTPSVGLLKDGKTRGSSLLLLASPWRGRATPFGSASPIQVVARRAPGQSEPWRLLTNLEAPLEACRFYEATTKIEESWKIEESSRDEKGLLGLEQLTSKRRERMEKGARSCSWPMPSGSGSPRRSATASNASSNPTSQLRSGPEPRGLTLPAKAIKLMCSRRGVAQPGSAPALGAGGRQFKSDRPDWPGNLRAACARSSAG